MLTTMPPKLAFFGTPELCLPLLEALVDANMAPAVVVTNPDRPVGRKQVITPPPVKVWAEEHGIEVLQPESLDAAWVEEFAARKIDLSIVVAYGQILPERLIAAPRLGTINIHYSLLPRWRGATPVEAAILAGDTTTGVTIQQMVQKLDAGPILAAKELPIQPDDTTESLKVRLNTAAGHLLVASLPDILAGRLSPTPQDDAQATFCRTTQKADAEVSLGEPDEILWRKYRAYQHWPRIFYFDEAGRRTIITEAAFHNEKFVIKKILPAGGREKKI